MKCECCGEEIGEIAFDKSFQMPDEIWNLSKDARDKRAKVDLDLCRLDDRYFLRGVAYIPVKNIDTTFGWGIWAEVPEKEFFDYVKAYKEDNSSKPRFKGKVANQVPSYENTLGLEIDVQLGNESERPTFYFSNGNHELVQEQTLGISVEKVHSFSQN